MEHCTALQPCTAGAPAGSTLGPLTPVPDPGAARRIGARRKNSRLRRGAELLEFTLALLPFMAMVFVLLDASWAIFVKSTLAYAVRSAVRMGVTVTGTQATAAGSNLTAMVKAEVQRKSLGLLAGTAGLAKIKVNYLQPPAVGSTAAATDVSTASNGNKANNIMMVSIQGFSLGPLIPRLFGLQTPMDNAPTTIAAVAADIIEPSRDVPPIGTAP
ncbi:MAG: TadE/TadG family type IV pilus assembly protein [Candidatus Solibacter sp.]